MGDSPIPSNLPSGGLDLADLLREMQPELISGTYVFCVVDPADERVPGLLQRAFASVREAEGLTLVLPEDAAPKRSRSECFRIITLRIHSSLEAVGLLATIAPALAAKDISANTLSAYYHDHLLIPEADAQAALGVLQALSSAARSSGAARNPG